MVKIYKPTSSGRRIHSVTDYSILQKNGKTPKHLIVSQSRRAGRNFSGKITVRHRGGGSRQLLRIVDFSRADKMDVPAKVVSVEYSPGRSAFLSLLSYRDGEKRLILAPHGIKAGDTVIAAAKTEPKIGNRMLIKNIPVGTY